MTKRKATITVGVALALGLAFWLMHRVDLLQTLKRMHGMT
jgi:hypothetical protein